MATSWLEEVVLEDLRGQMGPIVSTESGSLCLAEKWDLRGTLLSMGGPSVQMVAIYHTSFLS